MTSEGKEMRPDMDRYKEGKSTSYIPARQIRRSNKKALRRISRQQHVSQRSTVTPEAIAREQILLSDSQFFPPVYMKIFFGVVLVLMVAKVINEVINEVETRIVKDVYDSLPVSIPDYRITPLTHGVHDCHMKVPLPFIGWRLWTDGEHVFVGGRFDDRIVVMDKQGNFINSVSLFNPTPLLRYIITGFYIGYNQHLIVVVIYDGSSKRTLVLYRIVFSPDMQAIEYINQVVLPETFIPYRHNLNTSGILALNPTQTFLYHNRKLYYGTKLDDPCYCLTPSGVHLYDDHLFISDVETGNLAVFNNNGLLVDTLNTRLDPPKLSNPDLNQPGILFEPMNVFRDSEDRLIVPCSDGAIHMYSGNATWSIVVQSGQKAQDILTLDNNLFKIQDQYLYIFNIKN